MTFFLPQTKRNLPQFFYLLDDSDKQQYETIRKSQKEGQKKTEMNFSSDIQNLRKFVVRGNENDWKRGIVCGIYWLPGNKGIAVNIQQLKIILNKSKSSLNASLSKIGFNVTHTRGRAINQILDTFPFLNNHTGEVRQWTIRELANYSPPTSPIQSDIPQPVESEIFISIQNNENNELEFESSRYDECIQCNEIFNLCYC